MRAIHRWKVQWNCWLIHPPADVGRPIVGHVERVAAAVLRAVVMVYRVAIPKAKVIAREWRHVGRRAIAVVFHQQMVLNEVRKDGVGRVVDVALGALRKPRATVLLSLSHRWLDVVVGVGT